MGIHACNPDTWKETGGQRSRLAWATYRDPVSKVNDQTLGKVKKQISQRTDFDTDLLLSGRLMICLQVQIEPGEIEQVVFQFHPKEGRADFSTKNRGSDGLPPPRVRLGSVCTPLIHPFSPSVSFAPSSHGSVLPGAC